MLDPDNLPEIDADETLTRFLLQKDQLRKKDNTVKPAAFIAHPYEELSVNRLRECSDDETWEIGTAIANKRSRSLKGRADVLATIYLQQELSLEHAPVDGNPNHVNVQNWPTDQESQLVIAQEIAKHATLLLPI